MVHLVPIVSPAVPGYKIGHVTSTPSLLETMVNPDDYPGDVVPRLSLWQKLQILPIILALRGSPVSTTHILHHLIKFDSSCGWDWGLPREQRPLVAPCNAYRTDAVPIGGADMDSPGAQVFVRDDDRTSVCGVGAQERCGGAYR